MSQVKVTFKKLPELGQLVLVPDGKLRGEAACEVCAIQEEKTGLWCATVMKGDPCDAKHHWQKVKP
jgi:hypothetical protein